MHEQRDLNDFKKCDYIKDVRDFVHELKKIETVLMQLWSYEIQNGTLINDRL